MRCRAVVGGPFQKEVVVEDEPFQEEEEAVDEPSQEEVAVVGEPFLGVVVGETLLDEVVNEPFLNEAAEAEEVLGWAELVREVVVHALVVLVVEHVP